MIKSPLPAFFGVGKPHGDPPGASSSANRDDLAPAAAAGSSSKREFRALELNAAGEDSSGEVPKSDITNKAAAQLWIRNRRWDSEIAAAARSVYEVELLIATSFRIWRGPVPAMTLMSIVMGRACLSSSISIISPGTACQRFGIHNFMNIQFWKSYCIMEVVTFSILLEATHF